MQHSRGSLSVTGQNCCRWTNRRRRRWGRQCSWDRGWRWWGWRRGWRRGDAGSFHDFVRNDFNSHPCLPAARQQLCLVQDEPIPFRLVRSHFQQVYIFDPCHQILPFPSSVTIKIALVFTTVPALSFAQSSDPPAAGSKSRAQGRRNRGRESDY